MEILRFTLRTTHLKRQRFARVFVMTGSSRGTVSSCNGCSPGRDIEPGDGSGGGGVGAAAVSERLR